MGLGLAWTAVKTALGWVTGGATSSIRLWLIGLLAAGLASIIGLAYFHYTGLVADRARLEANQATLTLTLARSQEATAAAVEAVGEWKAASERMAQELARLAAVQAEARAEARRLNDLFSRHNLEELARAKPGLVERRVNAGTARALRLLECATGGGHDCPDTGGAPAAGAGAPRP